MIRRLSIESDLQIILDIYELLLQSYVDTISTLDC